MQEIFETTNPDGTGQAIISIHAIELGLKSILAADGVSEQELRNKFGHNLLALFDEAVRRGFSTPSPHPRKLLRWLTEWHSNGMRLRYEFRKRRTLPTFDVIVEIADQIMVSALIASITSIGGIPDMQPVTIVPIERLNEYIGKENRAKIDETN